MVLLAVGVVFHSGLEIVSVKPQHYTYTGIIHRPEVSLVVNVVVTFAVQGCPSVESHSFIHFLDNQILLGGFMVILF